MTFALRYKPFLYMPHSGHQLDSNLYTTVHQSSTRREKLTSLWLVQHITFWSVCPKHHEERWVIKSYASFCMHSCSFSNVCTCTFASNTVFSWPPCQHYVQAQCILNLLYAKLPVYFFIFERDTKDEASSSLLVQQYWDIIFLRLFCSLLVHCFTSFTPLLHLKSA